MVEKHTKTLPSQQIDLGRVHWTILPASLYKNVSNQLILRHRYLKREHHEERLKEL